jgi:hypothetical protein
MYGHLCNLLYLMLNESTIVAWWMWLKRVNGIYGHVSYSQQTPQKYFHLVKTGVWPLCENDTYAVYHDIPLKGIGLW